MAGQMDWSTLLNSARLGRADYVEHPDRPIYQQDADRIAFSAPFRRLANKTQVHPLYENDHVHHRLIHSVETASVGRSLGMSVGSWLEAQGHVAPGTQHKIAGLVHAACLAHDIGNPPFGHSGEAAIGAWCAQRFTQPTGLFADLDTQHRREFELFEGNAQGFRILTRLEMYRNAGGMQLSHALLGTFTKYPATAPVAQAAGRTYCGTKKFGLFDSEAALFAEIAGTLGLPSETNVQGRWWRRHPLVFLVEAADDICYNIIDIEDAFAADDLGFDTVERILAPVAGRSNGDPGGQTKMERISEMRARGIGAAISACVQAFIDNYDAIMAGTFSDALIEVSAKGPEFAEIKRIARERIFTARRKTELEVFGRNTLHRCLDGLLPVIEELRTANWQAEALSDYAAQVVRATDLDLRDVSDAYSALHGLTDFVSGMTDRHAVKLAGMLSGT